MLFAQYFLYGGYKNHKMRIGRNFTNMLEASFLNDEERILFKDGKLPVYNMDARVQIRAKRDIINQLKVGREIGLTHIELDGGVPNPFLEISDDEIKKAEKYAINTDMTISLHLPYTYAAASTCAFQESDRKIAVELQKRYIDFASKLGCISLVMHPGAVPFYQAVGEYLVMLKESLVKTLQELYPYAEKRNIVFHLENNTAFDSFGVENNELLDIINTVNKKGMNIKYCFDIGHWFTRVDVDKDKKIPEPPESVFDEIPESLLYEVHLNDYIPVIKKFHPPLYYEKGFLKKENLISLAKKFYEKKLEIVVVETAVREINELLNAKEILQKETEYLNRIFN